MDNYLNLVLSRAEEAFWTSVSNDFPAITTGDASPMQVNAFSEACKEAVTDFLKNGEQ